ncbi:MAG: hypothetical protein RL757_285 [Bacteroidota bacterium]
MENTIKKVDFIIVGQGLAGSILAFELMERGKTVQFFDQNGSDTGGGASRIAAGIINPVTGWRIVKTWKIDELLPHAHDTYTRMGAMLGDTFWQSRTIVRTIRNIEEENQWCLRASYSENKSYCKQDIFSQFFPKKLQPFRGFVDVIGAAQVDVPKLMTAFNSFLTNKNLISTEKFDFEAIKFVDDKHVRYKNFEAAKIIFCEGAGAVDNPYFQHLPFQLDKGELLLVKIPDFPLLKIQKIFKNKMSIVPLSDDLFWVGATNEWHFENPKPSEHQRGELVSALENMLRIPFEVVAHQAAVRPTVRDRRPLIGLHKTQPQLGIFNGLGTKGTSLAPYFASHFVAHLLDGLALNPEISIERFDNMKNKIKNL